MEKVTAGNLSLNFYETGGLLYKNVMKKMRLVLLKSITLVHIFGSFQIFKLLIFSLQNVVLKLLK